MNGKNVTLSLLAGLAVALPALASTPYAAIPARNVFGLVPPPVIMQDPPAAEPIAKIRPNGLMTIFGRWQVLFLVTLAAQPGQPAPPETAHILALGDSEDGISVLRINTQAGYITFDNHGIIQDLPFTQNPAPNPPPFPPRQRPLNP